MKRRISDLINRNYVGEVMVQQLRNRLKGNKFEGDLEKSIRYERFGSIITIYGADYGIFLDSGTKPHIPPMKKLKRWAIAKGIDEWALFWSIRKKGTKPHPFLAQMVKENKKIIDKYVKKDVHDLLKTLFSK